MAKELESAQSIVWMLVELKEHGQFRYEAWAQRFRPGEALRAPRDDRKFHHHLRFFKDQVLPEFLPGDAGPLRFRDGAYAAPAPLDEDSFGRLPGGENLLPFIHGLGHRRSLVPFPSSEIEEQLVEVLDVSQATLGPVLYKNKFQWRFDPAFLTTFLDAIHQGRQLLVTPKAPRRPREVTPLFLINYDGAWYLLGLTETLQQYNLSRVEGLSLAEAPAAPVSEARRRQLKASVEATFGVYLLHDWDTEGSGEAVTVRYRGRALPYAEERFDPRQQSPGDTWFETAAQPGALDVTVRVHAYQEVLSEVLRWGPDAEALAPEPFRRQWLDQIRLMADAWLGAGV